MFRPVRTTSPWMAYRVGPAGRVAVASFQAGTNVDRKRPAIRCADHGRLVLVASIDQPSVRMVVNPGARNDAFAREQA